MAFDYSFHTENTAIAAVADADVLPIYDDSTGRWHKVSASQLLAFSGAGLVTLTADATLTAATHGNRTLVMSEPGGNASATFTLPAATGTGNKYKFIVGVVNTSNYVIEVADATDIMYGNIVTNSTGDTPDLAQPWPTAADSDTITLNGTTTGGVAIGDFVELTDIAANTWAVFGHTTSSGTEATPFSAAVA